MTTVLTCVYVFIANAFIIKLFIAKLVDAVNKRHYYSYWCLSTFGVIYLCLQRFLLCSFSCFFAYLFLIYHI